jgi:hypothetical protein
MVGGLRLTSGLLCFGILSATSIVSQGNQVARLYSFYKLQELICDVSWRGHNRRLMRQGRPSVALPVSHDMLSST